MSARQAKNQAAIKSFSIEQLTNTNNESELIQETIDFENIEVKKDVYINTDIKTNINGELERLASIKNKIQSAAKRESNKQVTVYLTPKNYRRFNQLTEKGQKSDLINQLLDMYFEE